MTYTKAKYGHAEDCPDAPTHTPHPNGYLHHAAWADEISKTHTQHRCPTCGFWAIWREKRATVLRPTGDKE